MRTTSEQQVTLLEQVRVVHQVPAVWKVTVAKPVATTHRLVLLGWVDTAVIPALESPVVVVELVTTVVVVVVSPHQTVVLSRQMV
jgi:hypothetical protein